MRCQGAAAIPAGSPGKTAAKGGLSVQKKRRLSPLRSETPPSPLRSFLSALCSLVSPLLSTLCSSALLCVSPLCSCYYQGCRRRRRRQRSSPRSWPSPSRRWSASASCSRRCGAQAPRRTCCLFAAFRCPFAGFRCPCAGFRCLFTFTSEEMALITSDCTALSPVCVLSAAVRRRRPAPFLAVLTPRAARFFRTRLSTAPQTRAFLL